MAETGTEGDVPGYDDDGDESAAVGATSASKPWLKMIADAEKAFHAYQTKADNIDKLYANLERLANTVRDREIQLFWANISVMAPSIYSRPPVPVVVPRFKNDAELPRTASEILERATTVMFEQENVDGVMRLIRDDLVILARGAAWLRYDTTDGAQKVRVDHADRKDFLYEPARNWKEVDWVAKRSWLTKPQAKARFEKNSGKAYESLQYSVRKDAESDAADGASKAGVWELWSKSQDKVVWVAEGAQVCLDEGPPHLTLADFFPCPRPAFGTLERRGLVPVPDMLFYKDQLEEINEITARIAALTEAVRVRGFYPSGAGEVGDAIEAAMKSTANNAIVVPIANLAGLSGQSLKDAIAWLPIDVISATITAIINVRKQLIEDVYEVTGLSDIMRGQSEATETLGAQQLKSQYGSVRIKDRQDELTRVARDITRLAGEIMADNFSAETLMEMSQVRLPSNADIAEKAKPLQAQLKQIGKDLPVLQQKMQGLQQEIQAASQDPEVHQLAQAAPDQAQQVLAAVQQQMQADQAQAQQMQAQGQQAQQQLEVLAATVTIDKVVGLLREERLRPFILDIETDSTIAPDENASKQRATEFTTAIGSYLKNALPLLNEMPQAAHLVAETLKFVSSQYRAGRELQGTIDKFADAMEAKAQQPPPPNPAVIKAQADAAAQQAQSQKDAAQAQADQQAAQAEAAVKQAQAQKDAAQAQVSEADAQRALLEAHTKAQDADVRRKIEVQRELDASDARKAEIRQKAEMAALALATAREKHAQEMDKGALEMRLLRTKIAQAGAPAAGEDGSAPASDPAPAEEDIGGSGLKVIMQGMHEHHQRVHSTLEHLTKVMVAPTVIQRDANGHVIGSQKIIKD